MASKTAPRKAVTTDRRLQAMRLRVEGLNFQEIGDKLGISKPAAYMLVKGALDDYREATQEVAANYVQTHLLRYDAMIAGSFPDAKDPKLLPRDRKAAFDIVRDSMQEQAKLLGAYAPLKQEVTGKDGGPLATTSVAVTTDYSHLSADELMQLLELLKKTQPPAPGEGENN